MFVLSTRLRRSRQEFSPPLGSCRCSLYARMSHALAKPGLTPPSGAWLSKAHGTLHNSRGRHASRFRCECPSEAHRSPGFNFTGLQWTRRILCSKCWILEVWKPKRNVLSLPWRSKARAITTQQSGQLPGSLNARNWKLIAGRATDRLQEIKHRKGIQLLQGNKMRKTMLQNSKVKLLPEI